MGFWMSRPRATTCCQGLPLEPATQPRIPTSIRSSLYTQRVQTLAHDAAQDPPAETLEMTLRRCIVFCYGGTPEWAPHVRVTVFADNPSEHQFNVPVYGTLLRGWAVRGFETTDVPCKPIPGTDVSDGRIVANPFWSRQVPTGVSGKSVPCRALIHQLLHRFLLLDDADPRKQLLVNIMLQLHEACFNCIGRHKEVFEYCVYDLIEAEESSPTAERVDGLVAASSRAHSVVRHFAAWFLDRHKRNALHGACISPLKFLFQDQYTIYENLDSHGASFWVGVLCGGFFEGLEMPFEAIVELDTGWTWGAVDFLPVMRQGCQEALDRFAAIDTLGRDWRLLSSDLRPGRQRPRRLPGLYPYEGGFVHAIQEARTSRTPLRKALEPYAQRFAELLTPPVLLRCCGLALVSSARWDAELGPALAEVATGLLDRDQSTPERLRERLCCSFEDAAAVSIDTDLLASLLRGSGVLWV